MHRPASAPSRPASAENAAADDQHDLRRAARWRQSRFSGFFDPARRGPVVCGGLGVDRAASIVGWADCCRPPDWRGGSWPTKGALGPGWQAIGKPWNSLFGRSSRPAWCPAETRALALDVASSHFFDGSHYRLAATGDDQLTSSQMIDQLAALVDAFPIVSIEDGLAEDDWEGWRQLTARLAAARATGGGRFVHDQPAATGPRNRVGSSQQRAGEGQSDRHAVGDVPDGVPGPRGQLFDCRMVRSGETEDSSIADLAVAMGAEQIKIGSITRSERLAKYNRLLAIEEQLTAQRSG